MLCLDRGFRAYRKRSSRIARFSFVIIAYKKFAGWAKQPFRWRTAFTMLFILLKSHLVFLPRADVLHHVFTMVYS